MAWLGRVCVVFEWSGVVQRPGNHKSTRGEAAHLLGANHQTGGAQAACAACLAQHRGAGGQDGAAGGGDGLHSELVDGWWWGGAGRGLGGGEWKTRK
jgi:hypothetical protein